MDVECKLRLKDAEAALREAMTFPRTPFPSEIAKRYFEKWPDDDQSAEIPHRWITCR